MRVVHVAVLGAAAMVLASLASAQGLGDAAARERAKRAAEPAKPVKVYTDREVTSTPVSSDLDGQSSDAESGDGATTAEGGDKAAAAKKTDDEKAAAAAAEERAAAEADWRKRMDTARKLEAAYQDVIAKLEADLGNLANASFGPDRASKLNFLEENKKKLAEMQGNIAKIEDEGRQNGYH